MSKSYAQMAEEFLKKPTGFSWSPAKLGIEDPENWGFFLCKSCEGTLIELSNYDVAFEALKHKFPGDVARVRSYGLESKFDEYIAVRAQNRDCTLTNAFIYILELNAKLEKDELLDDSHFVRLQKQEAVAEIQEIADIDNHDAERIFDYICNCDEELATDECDRLILDEEDVAEAAMSLGIDIDDEEDVLDGDDEVDEGELIEDDDIIENDDEDEDDIDDDVEEDDDEEDSLIEDDQHGSE